MTLATAAADGIAWDREVRGFGLRTWTTAKGQRRAAWIVQRRVDGRLVRHTLGDAAVLARAEALKLARRILAGMVLGTDPTAAARQRRAEAALTLRAMLDAYRADQAHRWRPGSRAEVDRHLDINLQALHRLPATHVTTLAIDQALAGRSAVQRNRTTATLSAAFTWAMRKGLVAANPVIGVTRLPERSRSRVLSLAELRAVWKHAGEGRHGILTRLLILTGCRRDELGGLRRAEVDEATATITLPPERTKQGRAHTVPLGPLGMGLVRQLLRQSTAPDGGELPPFTGWGAGKVRLDGRLRRAGHTLPEWKRHDLRRSLATAWAAVLDAQPHVVEAQLGHVVRGVAGVYNRADYLDARRALMEQWEQVIVGTVTLAAPVKASRA